MAKFLNHVFSEDLGACKGVLIRALTEPLIWVHEEKRMEIPAGFPWDGASVPRWPLVYDAFGDRIHGPEIPHDYGYRKNSVLLIVDPRVNDMLGLMPEEYIIRKEAMSKEDVDWYFRITMREHTCPEYPERIYQPMYLAVRLAGGPAFHKMNVEDKFVLDK